MREIRLYGSEGGEAKAFPTPITISQSEAMSCNAPWQGSLWCSSAT